MNRERCVGDVMVGSSLTQRNNEMLEVLILGVVRRQISRTVALDFQMAVQGVAWSIGRQFCRAKLSKNVGGFSRRKS